MVCLMVFYMVFQKYSSWFCELRVIFGQAFGLTFLGRFGDEFLFLGFLKQIQVLDEDEESLQNFVSLKVL